MLFHRGELEITKKANLITITTAMTINYWFKLPNELSHHSFRLMLRNPCKAVGRG